MALFSGLEVMAGPNWKTVLSGATHRKNRRGTKKLGAPVETAQTESPRLNEDLAVVQPAAKVAMDSLDWNMGAAPVTGPPVRARPGGRAPVGPLGTSLPGVG